MYSFYRLYCTRLSIILAGLFSLCIFLFAGQAEAALTPTPVNAQWGYLNQSGQVVISHQFERAGNFVGGFAAVRVGGQEGYIDTTGKMLVAPQFASAADFSDKMARVNVGGTWNGTTVTGGKWGYIDQSGKVVIEPQFEDAQDFAEGLAAVKVDGKWGYVDKQGKITIKPRFAEAYRFSQSLALVRGTNYFYINPLGKTIIEPQKVADWSDTPGHFSEDLARVKIRDKWGYIDRRGNLVIAAEYDAATEFDDSIAPVQFEGRWGYLNKKGTLFIQPQFEWADRFYGDRAIVKVDGKFGFIDRSGKLVIPAKYTEVTHFSDGLAAVKTIDGWGYIDSLGSFKIQPTAKKAQLFSGGLAATRLGPGWGYVDEQNKFVIAPKYDWAGEFTNGIAFVKVDELYGCINPAGEWIVQPQYVGYSNFQNGTALISTVKADPAANMYIDSAGNVVKRFVDFLQTNSRNNEHHLKEGLSVMAPDGLKVYQEPDLNSMELGLLPYGTIVQIMEHTFEPVELEGIKGHWVAVDYNGEKGYIFDGLLSHLKGPELGSHFSGAISPFVGDTQNELIWYEPGESMLIKTSPSGILEAYYGFADAESLRWDIYIPGVSLREAFLLVRSLATEEVTLLNGKPVAEGTLIKDIPFMDNNGQIVLEVKGIVRDTGPVRIVIEKERYGYIHIYQLYSGQMQ